MKRKSNAWLYEFLFFILNCFIVISISTVDINTITYELHYLTAIKEYDNPVSGLITNLGFQNLFAYNKYMIVGIGLLILLSLLGIVIGRKIKLNRYILLGILYFGLGVLVAFSPALFCKTNGLVNYTATPYNKCFTPDLSYLEGTTITFMGQPGVKAVYENKYIAKNSWSSSLLSIVYFIVSFASLLYFTLTVKIGTRKGKVGKTYEIDI